MKPKIIAINKLKPNPNNPRTINKSKFEKLKKSITEFPKMLELRPIVVDEAFMVLGGNMRLQALKELGINGYGFYNTFIHLDTRKKETFWDNTNSDFGQVDISTGEKKNLWRTLRIMFQPEAQKENKLNFLILIVLVGILVYFAVKKI